MQMIPESTLLDQIKREEGAAFEILYKFYFPAIAAYVTRNNGNTEDAEDVFQEAIIALLCKVRQADFVLTSSLKTYLFAIAKNLWLKRLRDRRPETAETLEEYSPFEESLIDVHLTKVEQLHFWLSTITENCQRILKAIFFYQEPMASLMQRMGWKNKHTAANQQYKCIQQIKRRRTE